MSFNECIQCRVLCGAIEILGVVAPLCCGAWGQVRSEEREREAPVPIDSNESEVIVQVT